MGYKSPPPTDEEHERYLLVNDLLRQKQRLNHIIHYINKTHKDLVGLHEWGDKNALSQVLIVKEILKEIDLIMIDN